MLLIMVPILIIDIEVNEHRFDFEWHEAWSNTIVSAGAPWLP